MSRMTIKRAAEIYWETVNLDVCNVNTPCQVRGVLKGKTTPEILSYMYERWEEEQVHEAIKNADH